MSDRTHKQALRLKAIRLQLVSLRYQADAIATLDIEHAMGVENTLDCKMLYDRTVKLVDEAENLANQKDDPDSDRKALATFQQECQLLKEAAADFTASAGSGAAHRLGQVIDRFGSVPKDEVVPKDQSRLAAKAGHCCFKAETIQYLTFSNQIEAICDLTGEFLFTAKAGKAVK